MEVETTSGEGCVMVRVLMARYGRVLDGRLQIGSQLALASAWWKDLNKSRLFGDSEDRFKDGLRKLVGNGCDSSFWHDTWAGQFNLAAQFERLF